MKKLYLFLAATLTAAQVNAQFKVSEIGRVAIGTPSADIDLVATNARDTIPALNVYGPCGELGEGARITFGDNASKWNRNALIGELGTSDSDMLWMQGKKGWCLTHGRYANDTILIYDDNAGNFAKFNCDVKTTGLFIASDESFKKDICEVEDSKTLLAGLRPVHYTLLPFIGEKGDEVPATTEKEQRDAKFYKEFYAKIAEGSPRYGLIAQEVEKYFPELVVTDKNGKKYVDYIGFIPLLIGAINDFNVEIESLKADEDTEIFKKAFAPKSNSAIENTTVGLRQNRPNPFSSTTSIDYVLPEGTINAQIRIFDLQGKLVKTYPLDIQGMAGTINISSSNLYEGMFIYALVADGQEIDVKRMMMTK